MKTTITPFSNDATSETIGGLTVENGADKVVLYGSIEITHDKQGLERGRALKAIIDAAVLTLERDTALADHLATVRPTVTVKNPFD